MRTRKFALVKKAGQAPFTCEALEGRQLLATFTVDASDDLINADATTSLREAIQMANAMPDNDVILFDSGVTNIQLGSQLSITSDMLIIGNGARNLTIDGNNTTQIFDIDDGNGANQALVTITGMTLTNGIFDMAARGAAIYNVEDLVVDSVAFIGNGAFNFTVDVNPMRANDGGAIANLGGGILTVQNSLFAINLAFAGGGISNDEASRATVINSTFSDNGAINPGGAIFSSGNSFLTLDSSTLTLNRSAILGGQPGQGGGLALGSSTDAAQTIITNSIIAGNFVGVGTTPNDVGLTQTNIGSVNGISAFNIIGSASPGQTTLGLNDGVSGNQVGVNDPMLGARANNGGQTNTHLPQAGSPAIDAGQNALDVTTDQRNVPRTLGMGTDVGAAETGTLMVTAGDALNVPLFDTSSIADDATIYFDANMDLVPDVGEMLVNADPAADLSFSVSGMNTQGFAAGDQNFLIVYTSGGAQIGPQVVVPVTVESPASQELVVESEEDSGPGTLRDAILQANMRMGLDRIRFSLPAGTIISLLTPLTVTDATTITGPGSSSLTVQRSSLFVGDRLLTIDDGDAQTSSEITISGVQFDGNQIQRVGDSDRTVSGLSNSESLIFSDVTIANFNIGLFIEPTGTLSAVDVSIMTNSRGLDNRGQSAITRGRIDGNSGTLTGAGIYNDGTLAMSESSVVNNQAFLFSISGGQPGSETARGGGIFHNGGTLAITNSTISGNTTSAVGGGPGGGIYVTAGTVDISNSTIANNEYASLGTGNGIYLAGGTTTLRSSIVSNTAIRNGTAMDISGPSSLAAGSSHNVISSAGFAGGLSGGTNNNLVGVDAMLAPLGDNGTHLLQVGSPAIDAGSNPLALAIDQRGMPRAFGGGIDIGAIEIQDGEAVVPTGADSFIQLFQTRFPLGLSNDDTELGELINRVSETAYSQADWTAENYWFQDSQGNVWAFWHGGPVHELPGGQHRWVLTSLSEAGGLVGDIDFEPGSLSGVITRWSAFSIQGVSNGQAVSLWWSPESSRLQFGRRDNGWVLTPFTTEILRNSQTGQPLTSLPNFAAFSESQSNGRFTFDPRSTRESQHGGLSFVLVATTGEVFVATFTTVVQALGIPQPELPNVWLLEPIAGVPGIARFDLLFDVSTFEAQYRTAAGI